MVQPISFNDPYSVRALEIERRRRMAEQLRNQAQQPIRNQPPVGGVAIRNNPLQGLAQMLQSYTAGQELRGADQESRQLAQQYEGERQSEMDAIAKALRGQEAIPNPPDEVGGGPGRAAVPPNRDAALDVMMRSRDPMMQRTGFGLMAQGLTPKPPIRQDVGDKILILDGTTGQQIGEIPKAASPDARLRAQTTLDTSILNPAVAEAKRGVAKSGASNVSLKVENKMGESIAKEVGPIVSESRAAAMGASDQLDTAARINQALASGKVISGPGATPTLALLRVGQVIGVGGKNQTEILQNTRQVIKGLAEFTLSARKQLKGQGQVSDYEGKLIEKASSGDIDSLSIPEIKVIAEVGTRLAKKQIEAHQRNVDVMRRNPSLEGIVPFYEVPTPQGGWDDPLGLRK